MNMSLSVTAPRVNCDLSVWATRHVNRLATHTMRSPGPAVFDRPTRSLRCLSVVWGPDLVLLLPPLSLTRSAVSLQLT